MKTIFGFRFLTLDVDGRLILKPKAKNLKPGSSYASSALFPLP